MTSRALVVASSFAVFVAITRANDMADSREMWWYGRPGKEFESSAVDGEFSSRTQLGGDEQYCQACADTVQGQVLTVLQGLDKVTLEKVRPAVLNLICLLPAYKDLMALCVGNVAKYPEFIMGTVLSTSPRQICCPVPPATN